MQRIRFRFVPYFDARVEPNPSLYFRLARSIMVQHQLVRFPILGGDTSTWYVDIPKSAWDAAAHDDRTCFLAADLFCDTLSELDQVLLPCRREVARCVATWEDIREGRTVNSADQVAGHVKFQLAFEPHPEVYGPKTTAAIAQHLVSKMFQLALASNRTFADPMIPWIHPGAHAMNVSYVEMVWSPSSSSSSSVSANSTQQKDAKPVPGWADLYHLLVDIPSHTAPEAYYALALRNASRSLFGSAQSRIASPLNQCEWLTEAAASLARRSVYLSDTVDVTPYDPQKPPLVQTRRQIQDVDYYNSLRVVDQLNHVGDDCESLSKETLLFLTELGHLEGVEDGQVRLAQQIARRYVWVQSTGGVSAHPIGVGKEGLHPTSESKAAGAPPSWMTNQPQFLQYPTVVPLICHSWVLGIERHLFDKWIQRGANVLSNNFAKTTNNEAEAEDAKKWPGIVNVESTEWMASVPYQSEAADMKQLHHWHAFRRFSSFPAFRIKLPYAGWRGSRRYALVTTLTICDPEMIHKLGAAEFVVASLQPTHPAGFEKGVDFERLLQMDESVILLPTVLLSSQDIADAVQVLDYYPPLPAVPLTDDGLMHDVLLRGLHFANNPAFALSTSSSGGFQVMIREQDWHEYEQALEEWCSRQGYRVGFRIQTDFDHALMIVCHILSV